MKRIASALGFLFALMLMMSLGSGAQTEPTLEAATPAILKAFQSPDIVMLGETHGNKQEYDWLRSLVATPEFANRVDDIVMEFGTRYSRTLLIGMWVEMRSHWRRSKGHGSIPWHP
jgi:hypothetical protein